ncbi:MAG: DUF4954 family protein [Bacteroidales bacterium]
MDLYRKLRDSEIATLQMQGCSCNEWDRVLVDEKFDPQFVRETRMSGDIRLSHFGKEVKLSGGVVKKSGIYNARLHNVTVGENSCIENIHNYIANYTIGKNCIIENVDRIVTDSYSTFGNGYEVPVLNETGGREVMIHDKLTAHFAYIMALYRHRPTLIDKMRELVIEYSQQVKSSIGEIGNNVTILNTGLIESVRVGEWTKIEGVQLLSNGTINSNRYDPVYIGYGCSCKNFIISSGAKIESGSTIENVFVGQSTLFSRNYSAENSLFFSNCHGHNGEASAIFAGPFTVSYHKATLLIAGMFSFMNAGSGSNQSNHIYKLGPIHQGILERGSKTSSDSYLLWPARVGAFSLVMGRHVNNSDTTDLPFSYLIEKDNTTILIPGVNLKSVGTIRDAKKWPARDGRKDPNKLDQINYNLLSPYTISKMLRAIALLNNLRTLSGESTDIYTYKGVKINNHSLSKGIVYYEMAIRKFMGNSIIKRLEGIHFKSNEEIVERLIPDTPIGEGEWIDLSGLIAPKSEIDRLLCMIEQGEITDIEQINSFIEKLHSNYYNYEWSWVYNNLEKICKISPQEIKAKDIEKIVIEWRKAVVGIDNMLYEDAKKEFSLSSMTSFGADGNPHECVKDFEEVRGQFETNKFVMSVKDHIKEKQELAQETLSRIEHLIK